MAIHLWASACLFSMSKDFWQYSIPTQKTNLSEKNLEKPRPNKEEYDFYASRYSMAIAIYYLFRRKPVFSVRPSPSRLFSGKLFLSSRQVEDLLDILLSIFLTFSCTFRVHDVCPVLRRFLSKSRMIKIDYFEHLWTNRENYLVQTSGIFFFQLIRLWFRFC